MAPPVYMPVLDLKLSRAQLYACIPLALLVYLVVKPLIQTLLSPLSRVPGPFLARFTRLWELHAIRKHDFAAYNIALHEKYGSLLRIRPSDTPTYMK